LTSYDRSTGTIDLLGHTLTITSPDRPCYDGPGTVPLCAVVELGGIKNGAVVGSVGELGVLAHVHVTGGYYTATLQQRPTGTINVRGSTIDGNVRLNDGTFAFVDDTFGGGISRDGAWGGMRATVSNVTVRGPIDMSFVEFPGVTTIGRGSLLGP
jgi:hypothetical protein